MKRRAKNRRHWAKIRYIFEMLIWFLIISILAVFFLLETERFTTYPVLATVPQIQHLRPQSVSTDSLLVAQLPAKTRQLTIPRVGGRELDLKINF